MRLRPTPFLLTVLLAAAASAQPGDGYYHTAGSRLVGPDGQPAVLRGMGLGGWLMPEGYMLRVPGHGSPTTIREAAVDVAGEEGADRYFALYRENYVREEDVAALAAWGYDHVRLPFHYKVLWDEEAGTFDEDGFALVDRFLGWCRTYGLPVVFDMHAAPGGQSEHNIADAHGTAELWVGPNAQANQDLTVHIWEEIARRYRDDRNVVGYDFINEPVLPEGVTRAELRALYVRLTDAVRDIDPHHVVFIEGDFFANFFEGLTPAFDDNMVWSFHKYWSSVGQGSIQYLLDLREATGVPLWLGETGENSNAWFYAVRTLAEANRIGWNWWTHKKIETVSAPASALFAPGYEAVVDYWRGRGPRPSADAARTALFAMANGLDLDRTVRNEGVIAALFDDAFGTTARPYRAHAIPGSIHAADYDLGDHGVAYGDQDPWVVSGTPGSGNTGGVYRNDGVDIERSTDPQGHAYNVGWIEALEWLQYTVTVAESGTYDVEFRVASGGTGGRFTVSLGGESLGSVTVPGTGGWQAWRSAWLRGLALPAGEHVLKLAVRTGGYNLNTMRFTRVGGTATEEAPEATGLDVFPNPARGAATVAITLAAPAEVRVEVLDVLGRRVTAIEAGALGAGRQSVALGLDRAAPGVYLVRVTAGASVLTQTVTLQR